MPSVSMVSGCVAWIQFNSPLEFLPPSIQIPIEAIQDECKRVVGFAKRIVQLESTDRRQPSLRGTPPLVSLHPSANDNRRTIVGNYSLSRCVVWGGRCGWQARLN